MTFPQDTTPLVISTPLGDGALLLTRIVAEEALSAPFRIDLEMSAADASVDFRKIVGKPITASIRMAGDTQRYFHGVVVRFVQAAREDRRTVYRAEVRPTFWLLKKTRDSKVFQEKAVPDIVKEVLTDNGVKDFKNALRGSYSPRLYCVQYQESAFEFVSRLLEEEGIYYFFEHVDGKHTLVIGDDPTAHPACPNLSGARFLGNPSTSTDQDLVTSCSLVEDVVAGGYDTTDYDETAPKTSLAATVDAAAPSATASLRIFEYPGRYVQKSAGDALSRRRIEEEEAPGKRLEGTSYCRAFTAGHTFDLSGHDRDDVNATWVLGSVVHTATPQEYANSFTALPKNTPYRPPRLTPRPYIAGSQTAVVCGKPGEEIFTDKLGRIKVQFFWDRYGKNDDKSSCWVRVSQAWAGNSWGAIYLPRVGQEVVVSFLEGDPDRPIVTGSVYNGEQAVPYPLPGERTKSTLKSRSSKQGDAGNEIRFEDKKGSEELFVHAQKDMTVTVENDRVTSVLHDETVTVKNKRSVTIQESDESLVVQKGNRTVDVQKGDETHSVKGKRTLTVEGDESHTNKGALSLKVTKDYTLKVDGDLTIDVSGAVTIKAGGSLTLKSGQAFNAEAGTSMSNKANQNITNKANMSMTNEAGMSLTNKAGASQTVDGGGMLTLKGGLVKIN